MTGPARPKVLFVASTYWYPTEDQPQHGTFVREHARAAATNADVLVVHLLGTSAGPIWPRFERVRDTSITLGLPTVRLRYRTSGRQVISSPALAVAMVWASLKVRGLGFRPDLIHANVYEVGISAVAIARLRRLPVVVTEHYSRFARFSVPKMQLRLARRAFGKADRVLPVSAFLRDAIIANDIEARFTVVPNVADTETFHPPTSPRAGPIARILLIANLYETDGKGVGALLEALSALDPVKTWSLEVVGTGEGLPGFRARAGALGIGDRVEFLGAIAHDAVADRMRDADLLVVSSPMETQSVVILEALASELPVVATRVGGIPETLADNGRYVEPGDVEGLAAALDDLIGSKQKVPAGARARVIECYSRASVGVQLATVYADVLRERSNVGS